MRDIANENLKESRDEVVQKIKEQNNEMEEKLNNATALDVMQKDLLNEKKWKEFPGSTKQKHISRKNKMRKK